MGQPDDARAGGVTLMQAAGIGLALIGIACGCLTLAACLSIPGMPGSRSGRRTIAARRRGLYQFRTLLGPVGGGALATGAACITLGSSGRASPTNLFIILPSVRAQVAAMPLAALFWLLIGVPMLAMGLSRAGALPLPVRTAPLRDLTDPVGDPPSPTVAFALLAVFLALVTAADGLSLVLLWQAAATLLGLLVIGITTVPRHTRRDRRRRVALAAIWPAALQAGGVCLLATMLLFDSGCGSLHFADLRACGPRLDAIRQSSIFLLTVLACGSAVLVPLLGLPDCRPRLDSTADTRATVAAPSRPADRSRRPGTPGDPGRLLPVILAPCVALYPLLLIPFSLLGPGPAWWGALLVAIGAVAAPIGALRCVGARSVWGLVRDGGIAQAGVVVICLGSALLLRHAGRDESVALEAALLCAVTGTAATTLLALAAWTPWSAGVPGAHTPEGWWARAPFMIGLVGLVLIPTLGSTGGGWLALQALLAVAGSPGPVPFAGGLALCGAGALCLSAALGIASATLIAGRAPHRVPPGAGPDQRDRNMHLLRRAAVCIAGLPVLAVALAPQAVTALLRPALQELGGGREIAEPGAGPLGTVESLAMHAHFSALGIVLCLAGYAAACAFGAQWAGNRRGQSTGTQPDGATLTAASSAQYGGAAPNGSHDTAIPIAVFRRRFQAPFDQIAARTRRHPSSRMAPGAPAGRGAALRQRGRGAIPVAMARLGGSPSAAASLLSLVALFVALLVLVR